MASKTTVLDLSNDEYLSSQGGAPVTIPGSTKEFAVSKTTKRGGLADGTDVLEVTSGDFRVSVVPTRGMGIWEAWHESERIGWRSPVRGPVHPKFVDVGEPSGLGWLSGFDELLVRCGLESNGAPEFGEDGSLVYPLHGRIANMPAHRVDVTIDSDAGEITIVGVVEETRFHFSKLRMTSTITVKVGETGFHLHDELENISQSPAEIQMLYHVNFGDPLLDAGSKVVAPIKTVVPRNARAAEGIKTWETYEAPHPGFEEQVYFSELLSDAGGRTQALLRNAHGTRGALLIFNKQQLPCLTVWKNTTALADGYVTGIEPGTNFPNPRSHEGAQGRVVSLEPGGSFGFDLQLKYLSDAASVAVAADAIAELQGDTQPQVYEAPQEGWCEPRSVVRER